MLETPSCTTASCALDARNAFVHYSQPDEPGCLDLLSRLLESYQRERGKDAARKLRHDPPLTENGASGTKNSSPPKPPLPPSNTAARS